MSIGLVLLNINPCKLFNAQFFLQIYIEFIISEHIL